MRLQRMAVSLGFEPKYYAPEAYVLPLDDKTMLKFWRREWESNPQGSRSTVFKTATVSYRFASPYGQGSQA